MSLVKISGNASGTGTLTIAAPNTNTNYTLTLPTETGTLITTTGGQAIAGTTGSFSGNLSFNSGYGSAAVAYGCRAWVNFNGTGTVAIRASGNVSSITDNGTGDYRVNFTTAMPDANYSASGGFTWSNNANELYIYNFQTTSMGVGTYEANAPIDRGLVTVAIFR